MKITIKYSFMLSLKNLDDGIGYAKREIEHYLTGSKQRLLLRPQYCLIVTIRTMAVHNPAVIAANVSEALKLVARSSHDPHIINVTSLPEPGNTIQIMAAEFKDLNHAG